MKTKHIPVLIALAAGLITCIISFLEQVSMGQFVRNLCLILVLFYILGCVVKLILDKNFPMETEEEETLEPEEGAPQEEAGQDEGTEEKKDVEEVTEEER